jgi:hypothetical protein
MTLFVIALVCSAGGLFAGWLLFRSERVYRQGFLDGERHGRSEGFRTAIRKTHRSLLNPQTENWNDDWYDD